MIPKADTSILRVDHADIREFINCKRQLSEEQASIFRRMAPHLSQEAAEKLNRALLDRQISFALRVEAVMPPRDRLALIAKQLQGIGGSRSAGLGKNRISSLPDGAASILLNYVAEGSDEAAPVAGNPAAGNFEVVRGDLCPDCGNATVKHAEGCSK
jgi:hypothetical protein